MFIPLGWELGCLLILPCTDMVVNLDSEYVALFIISRL